MLKSLLDVHLSLPLNSFPHGTTKNGIKVPTTHQAVIIYIYIYTTAARNPLTAKKHMLFRIVALLRAGAALTDCPGRPKATGGATRSPFGPL